MNSKVFTAVELALFIEKMRYYEEGLVEMIRKNLIGIGLTENRAYFSHKYINSFSLESQSILFLTLL